MGHPRTAALRPDSTIPKTSAEPPRRSASKSTPLSSRFVTFRRRQHEISKVDRTVFSDVGVASENGK
ncbi:hypothetical protein APB43_34340 [Pseudomonas aeruginosa]|nr:hypothetical protein APB43_34340 [Pseudomonas aeruginosa]